jgi:glycosyltransferase involved in cell wall biosynthesis
VIIVDDGSSDQTWDIIRHVSAANHRIRGILLSRNYGKEAAICAGLEHAKGDAVIVMDADMQHPPDLLASMIGEWRNGAEIVECVKKTRGSESLLKAAGSRLFYGLLSLFTGHDLRGASDFKLLDRKVLQAWQTMPEINTFFRGMTQWMGFRRIKIEFDVKQRINGPSRWSLYALTKLAAGAIISFSSLPLRVVSIFGIFFLLGAVLLGGQTLFRKIIGDAVTGFTTVILLQLIIGSIIMVSLGIIGEYIAAIYNEIKRRPRYLISTTVGEGHEKQ